MNNYKFGNYICELREKHNLTQKEFAAMLDVSDKAVSKWENGQAIPRMDTLEKIAAILNTTVEQLLVVSHDNTKRICFVNRFIDIIHLDFDGKLISIKPQKEQWITVDTQQNDFILSVSSDYLFNSPEGSIDNAPFKVKLSGKFLKRIADDCILQSDCVYKLANVRDGAKIEITFDIFSLDDKVWLNSNFVIAYPKLITTDAQNELMHAKGKNVKDILRFYRRLSILTDIGIDFLFVWLIYPFRMACIRHLCRPEIIKKNINHADFYNRNENKNQKKRVYPFLKFVFLMLILMFGFLAFIVGDAVINVASQKPALVSEDYSSITLFKEDYKKIDELSFDADECTLLGADLWYDARIEGETRIEQAFSDNKVAIYVDSNGSKYLWLVCNYSDLILDDDGNEREYNDFDSHMVYKVNH